MTSAFSSGFVLQYFVILSVQIGCAFCFYKLQLDVFFDRQAEQNMFGPNIRAAGFW